MFVNATSYFLGNRKRGYSFSFGVIDSSRFGNMKGAEEVKIAINMDCRKA